MKKNIYAIYDEAVQGIPGTVFMDYNDSTVIRGLAEQNKEKPMSREVANDLLLVCLGSIDVQADITNLNITNETRVVGKFKDLFNTENNS